MKKYLNLKFLNRVAALVGPTTTIGAALSDVLPPGFIKGLVVVAGSVMTLVANFAGALGLGNQTSTQKPPQP